MDLRAPGQGGGSEEVPPAVTFAALFRECADRDSSSLKPRMRMTRVSVCVCVCVCVCVAHGRGLSQAFKLTDRMAALICAQVPSAQVES